MSQCKHSRCMSVVYKGQTQTDGQTKFVMPNCNTHSQWRSCSVKTMTLTFDLFPEAPWVLALLPVCKKKNHKKIRFPSQTLSHIEHLSNK